MTLESEDRSFCLKYYLAKTTLSMSSARRIALDCTACHKRFANRWAYNQHRTSGYRKGTSCKRVGLQQSELIANTRGNISTAVLRSTGALRKGRRNNSCYLHGSCIYMYKHRHPSRKLHFLTYCTYICKNAYFTPDLPTVGRSGLSTYFNIF